MPSSIDGTLRVLNNIQVTPTNDYKRKLPCM